MGDFINAPSQSSLPLHNAVSDFTLYEPKTHAKEKREKPNGEVAEGLAA
jgi:hypothetical protein